MELPFCGQKIISERGMEEVAERKRGLAMALFEIYFTDLHEEARKRYLEFEGVDDPSELNAEYSPICVLERDDDDEEQS